MKVKNIKPERSSHLTVSKVTLLMLTVFFLVTQLSACGAPATEDDSSIIPGGGGGGGGGGTTPGASVSLQWLAPTSNVDGSCIDGLSGYRLNYGTSSGYYRYSTNVDVADISCQDSGTTGDCGNIPICTGTVEGSNFSAGTWFISIQAYDSDGDLSDYSNEATGII